VGALYNLSMARRVAAPISLACSVAALAFFASDPLAAGTGVASPAASLPATGPPAPSAATQAFGRWLHFRYGSVKGYWTCPAVRQYRAVCELFDGCVQHSDGGLAATCHRRRTQRCCGSLRYSHCGDRPRAQCSTGRNCEGEESEHR
jgi:hypothetical protein